MIKDFEYIVSIDSGIVINIQTKDLYLLTRDNTIFWHSDIGEFFYNDNSFNSIIKFINKLKIGDIINVINTGKTGYLVDIIEDYQGEEVNGKDVSHLFNFGEDLYIIEYQNGRKGIYVEYQIEKYTLSNEVFV